MNHNALHRTRGSPFCSKKDEKSEEEKEEKSILTVIEESWTKAKEEMHRQQKVMEQQQKERMDSNGGGVPLSPSSSKSNDFIEKYEAYRAANGFEIEKLHSMDIGTQWAFYSIVWIKDPLYRLLMNWWVTGFADRFLFYEEFICGAVEGLEFMVQCLEEGEYEPLRECMVKEVYDHVEQLRDSVLKEEGFSMDKAMAHIFNVRVDREKVDLNQVLQRQQEGGGQNAGHLYNVPVEMAFDVKYFCKFSNEESGKSLYKIIDILWHSKFDPVAGEKLKYEITSPWTIHHITVSVVDEQGHSP